jgi:hypothetical protein
MKGKKMDYSQILKDLDTATSFDLYRLVSALNDEMRSVERIKKVRSGLRVGQIIFWFDRETNKLIESKILKLNKIRCLVRNLEDGVEWNIVYWSINTENKAVEINMNQKYGVKKSELKIGDTVTYVSKDNVQLFGTVVKLNQKTAGIKTINGQKWRVSYGFLEKVIEIEGEIVHRKFIEGF